MKISRIIINNYRLYKGENVLSFNFVPDKNIFLISGENGFGKTTFLHSLIWCLYGRLMSDIEASVKKDFANGGYSTYLRESLNSEVNEKLSLLPPELIQDIKSNGYSNNNESIKELSQYYVRIDFSDVVIPSLPCTSITIIRYYDAILEKESIEIFIDGIKNELTNEIGSEIFINDFILNKDIAKFFFFDSEQIVTLAETDSVNDKRKLCSAYNEVLGVRKYEDLKRNLENIRMRFRKKTTDVVLRQKLLQLMEKYNLTQSKISEIKDTLTNLDQTLINLKIEDDEIQQQLAREGSNITSLEIERLKVLIDVVKKKDTEYKTKIKDFIELAPLAITGKLLLETKFQVENDYAISKAIGYQESNNDLIHNIQVDFINILKSFKLNTSVSMDLQLAVQSKLGEYLKKDTFGEILIGLSKENHDEFISIFNNLISTYSIEFERLHDDYKKNKQTLERNSRRLSNITSKETDALIISLRNKKNDSEHKIIDCNTNIRQLHENLGILSQEASTLDTQIKGLSKKVNLDADDNQKDELAADLINELGHFLFKLKQEKKYALEKRIRDILNTLMHKEDFITRVEVIFDNDLMDIELFGNNDIKIPKDMLSKGEQQLYASSILKAFVEESGIEFPVFIDSPLQKFDKSHASKIITDFYPNISKQVVLFPLMHKELTLEEFEIMLPYVTETYSIRNDISHSYISKVDKDHFFNQY